MSRKEQVQAVLDGLPSRHKRHAEALDGANRAAAQILAVAQEIRKTERALEADSAAWSKAMETDPAAKEPASLAKGEAQLKTLRARKVALQAAAWSTAVAELDERIKALDYDAKDVAAQVAQSEKEITRLEQAVLAEKARLETLQAHAAAIAATREESAKLQGRRVRALRGSPAELEAALRDGRQPVDPDAAMRIIVEWKRGIHELANEHAVYSGGQATRMVFNVIEALLIFDAKTGRVLAHHVLNAKSAGGGEYSSINTHTLHLELSLQQIEQQLDREELAVV